MCHNAWLAQLRAERYGTIPLARRVGGLADTIEDGVTGFLFDEYSSEDLLRVSRHVMDRYHDTAAWEHLMGNAMRKDFSWARSAEKYMDVYRRILAFPAQS